MIPIIKRLAALGRHLVTSGADPEEERKSSFMGLLLIVGIVLGLGFLVHDLWSAQWVEAGVELTALIVFAVNLILLGRTKFPGLAYRSSLIIFTVLLLYVGISGGEHGSKIFWIYLLPHIFLFLLGAREGTLWSMTVFVVMATVMLARPMFVYPYPPATVLRFALSYLTISVSALILEVVRSAYHVRMVTEHNRLTEANRRIERLSVTDPLTGLFNRGYMDRRLAEEVRRSERYGQPLAIVLCDVDYFKQVNDEFGHQVGDKLLIGICGCIVDSLRQEVDWVARYGGEELLIVLPETTADGAIVVAERLRRRVGQEAVVVGDRKVSTTASLGVVTSENGTSGQTSHEELIRRADLCLYRAKESGRDQVVGETEELREVPSTQDGGHTAD